MRQQIGLHSLDLIREVPAQPTILKKSVLTDLKAFWVKHLLIRNHTHEAN